MEDLGNKIKGQSAPEGSEGSNILSTATKMLKHMECLVELLQ